MKRPRWNWVQASALGAGSATLGFLALAFNPWIAIGLAVLPVAMIAGPSRCAAFLLLPAALLSRPSIFGEIGSEFGLALAVLSGVFAVLADGKIQRPSKAQVWILLLTIVLWFWVLSVVVIWGTIDTEEAVRGAISIPAFLTSALIVFQNQSRRRLFVSLFVTLVLATCASYVISALFWLTGGVSSGQLGSIQAGYTQSQYAGQTSSDIYFPFTTTQSFLTYGGLSLPRFLGIGREPGIMAFFIVWCFFVAPQVFRRSFLPRLILVLGLLGTQSTAGFAVLLFATAVQISQSDRARRQALSIKVLIVGVSAVVGVGALYAALFAPVFGLFAKESSNRASVDDRSVSTTAGIRAMGEHFFGGAPLSLAPQNPGINVLASGYLLGAVGVAICVAMLLVPLCAARCAPHQVTTSISLLITVMLSQPLLQSSVFYAFVLLSLQPLRSSRDIFPPLAVVSHDRRGAEFSGPRVSPRKCARIPAAGRL